MPETPASSIDFIRNWIINRKKEETSEIIVLIEKRLRGINLDELDEENLLKDIINLVYKEVENDSH